MFEGPKPLSFSSKNHDVTSNRYLSIYWPIIISQLVDNRQPIS